MTNILSIEYDGSTGGMRTARILMLITIKTYPTLFEAEAARIALDVADIPCVVVGVGVAMQGGMAGVQLQVPQNHVDAALEVLKED